jgi:murein endopeptidase
MAVAGAVIGAALVPASGAPSDSSTAPAAVPMPLVPLGDLAPARPEQRIRWRKSKAVGLPYAGRLVRGVQLPAEGRTYFTWDPIRETTPNRGWRRWGTDRLIRTTLRVARRYEHENPDAPRLAIGDLSRPRGGDFGPQYGELGHASHQNGLDVDIYYPRRDRRETAATRPSQVDLRLSQRLVDMFVAAGAQKVFVGPSLDLHGPRRVVSPLVHHDNHLHVRLPG